MIILLLIQLRVDADVKLDLRLGTRRSYEILEFSLYKIAARPTSEGLPFSTLREYSFNTQFIVEYADDLFAGHRQWRIFAEAVHHVFDLLLSFGAFCGARFTNASL